MLGVDNKHKRIGFEYNVMPQLRPIAITTGKGFWGAIWMWLTGTVIGKLPMIGHIQSWVKSISSHRDLNLMVRQYPSSYTWLSPTGVLLMGGLVHDYAYKYETLLKSGQKETMGKITQKRIDQIFRDINIEQEMVFISLRF